MNKSKLMRKRAKNKGNRSLNGQENFNKTPVRTPIQTVSDKILHDSPPYPFLNSQAPSENEVHWDYDTPQIRKYRSRMGVGVKREDDSPVLPPIRLAEHVTTPKTSPKSSPKKNCRVDPPNPDAEAAYNDLANFFNKLTDKRKLSSEMSYVSTESELNAQIEKSDKDNFIPEPVISEKFDSLHCDNTESVADATTAATAEQSPSAYSDALLLSDDDSLLLKCSQQLDDDESKEHSTKDEFGFESDDSFEIMVSQMSESEMLDVPRSSPDNITEPDRRQCNEQKSDLSARSVKRFKSNDDCGRTRGGTPLRRIQSSPLIVETTQNKCYSQIEIEQKRLEAKRRRERRLGKH